MVKVSVVVPVYKTPENFLKECVKSVLSQSLENLELILVDDGSPDSCGTVCDAFSALDSRIHVVHQENRGVSFARNKGVSLAKGKYLLFLDADDFLYKDTLLFLFDFAERNQSDITLFEYRQGGKVFHLFDGADVNCFDSSSLKKLFCATVLPKKKEGVLLSGICCKFYRTDFIKQNELKFAENITSAEDQLFFLACLNEKPLVSYCARPFYEYRLVNNSASFSYTKNFHKQVLEYGDMLNSLINKSMLFDDDLILSTRMCQCILYSLSKFFFHRKNDEIKSCRKRMFLDFIHEKAIQKYLSSYKKEYFTWSERLGLQMCRYGLFEMINLASKRW